MEYTIAIPSFKRESLLLSHTLEALALTDIQCDIVVFTANEEETALYRKVLPPHVKVVTGVRGYPNQRNFIQRYFPVGQRLVIIDDDIKQIIGLNSDGKRVKATKLHDFFIRAFEITEAHGMKMWGINSTNSNLEMKHTVSVGRIYLVGNFSGVINTHDFLLDTGENIPLRKTFQTGKASHEISLLNNDLYGGVMKFRSFGVVSKYWGVPGGHQVSRTPEGEEQAARYLHDKYPDCTTLRFYKEVWDLVIKPKTKVLKMEFVQPC
jgi:hypothetical protein